MPYILRERRKEVRRLLGLRVGKLYEIEDITGGDLNFLICDMIDEFLFARAIQKEPEDLKYADFAEVIAALDGAKHEFRRLVLDPYEDRKRKENGRVFYAGT